jgi:hypothetical protein
MAEASNEKQLEVGTSDPLQPSLPRKSNDAPIPEDTEKSAAQDQFRTGDGDASEDRIAEHGGGDGGGDDDRPGLNRLRTTATTTSVTSTVATARLPEQKPWYKQPNPLRWGKIPPVPKEKTVSPEHKAGFFSRLVFHWMAPLMSTGYKRPLEFNDIYSVNPDRAVDPLTNKMRDSFKRRVAAGEKYPLLWAINETFFWEFWLGGLCSLISAVLQVMSPFTLRYLIQFATNAYIASVRGGPPPHIGEGIGLVLGVTAMQMCQSLATNHFIYRGMVIGGMARGSLISLIYEKSMVISGRAKAGGAELPDVPAAKAVETAAKDTKGKKEKEKEKKGPAANRSGISGDGVGWGNGRIVSQVNSNKSPEHGISF